MRHRNLLKCSRCWMLWRRRDTCDLLNLQQPAQIMQEMFDISSRSNEPHDAILT